MAHRLHGCRLVADALDDLEEHPVAFGIDGECAVVDRVVQDVDLGDHPLLGLLRDIEHQERVDVQGQVLIIGVDHEAYRQILAFGAEDKHSVARLVSESHGIQGPSGVAHGAGGLRNDHGSLFSRGTYSFGSEMLTYAGLRILFEVMSSSILWALHPTILAVANSGV